MNIELNIDQNTTLNGAKGLYEENILEYSVFDVNRTSQPEDLQQCLLKC